MSEKPLVVVSTCGTSLLTNAAGTDLGKLLRDAANKSESELSAAERAAIDDRAGAQKAALHGGGIGGAARLSAELKGIVSLYGKVLTRDRVKRDQHFLVHTDTYQGVVTAGLIREWLEAQGVPAQLTPVRDLRTSSLPDFQSGLSELAKWCDETLPGYRASNYHVVFNLTGSFKTVQGFMLALGMFYADESVYVFESPDAPLLRIPRLPVKMNALDTCRKHQVFFRRAALALNNPAANATDVPGVLVQVDGDSVTTTVWGDVVWSQHRAEVYGRELLDPPSDKIGYGPRFKDTVAKLASDRLVQVNQQIDTLARFAEESVNPASLDIRVFQRKRSAGKFLADAWSDGDARRFVLSQAAGGAWLIEDLITHNEE